MNVQTVVPHSSTGGASVHIDHISLLNDFIKHKTSFRHLKLKHCGNASAKAFKCILYSDYNKKLDGSAFLKRGLSLFTRRHQLLCAGERSHHLSRQDGCQPSKTRASPRFKRYCGVYLTYRRTKTAAEQRRVCLFTDKVDV